MTIKLKKQVIEILEVLKKKNAELLASELVNDLNIDYIVLMAAINDLIEKNLGGFREEDVNQILLNEEGINYLEKGLPERQLLKILIESNIKEINIEDLQVKAKLDKQIFYSAKRIIQGNYNFSLGCGFLFEVLRLYLT